jgi:hypothetical protein
VRQVNEKGHIGIVEKAKFRDGYANVLSWPPDIIGCQSCAKVYSVPDSPPAFHLEGGAWESISFGRWSVGTRLLNGRCLLEGSVTTVVVLSGEDNLLLYCVIMFYAESIRSATWQCSSAKIIHWGTRIITDKCLWVRSNFNPDMALKWSAQKYYRYWVAYKCMLIHDVHVHGMVQVHLNTQSQEYLSAQLR